MLKRLILISIVALPLFLFGGTGEAQAATKIKTVEVYITQDTSTTEDDSILSGAGVNDLAYSDANDVVFNIKIPENTVTFRHAYIEWRTYADLPNFTSGEMKFSRCTKGVTKAANCVATDTRTTNTTRTLGTGNTTTAESLPYVFQMGIPIDSNTLATGSVDYFFNAQLTGPSRTGDNAKIVITYEYSDTAATQLTTVKYGVGCGNPAGDAEETTLTAINPNINEDSVEILSHWVEYSFMIDGAAIAADTVVSSSFDTTVKGVPVVIDNDSRDSNAAFLVLQEYASSSMDTLAERTSAHTITLFSNVLTGTTDLIDNKCAEWVVTYLFASSSATKTRTVAYFVGTNDNITTREQMGAPAVFLPESSLTHRSVWLRHTLNTFNASVLTSSVKIPGAAASTSIAQTVSKATASNVGGENRFIHDVTSYFTTNWSSGETVTASVSADTALDAVTELFITSSFADSSATAIKTVYWLVGQDLSVNTAGTIFGTLFTTYVPETVSVASRSTAMIHRAGTGTGAGATSDEDMSLDDGARAGLDNNTNFLCAEENEAHFCLAGFSPSTQLTPQSAQTDVRASLSNSDEHLSGAYAYSTYEFQWSAVSTFTQNDFEWFVDNNKLGVTDVWPDGSVDLAENAVLTSIPAQQALASGSEIRIRVNITITGTALGANSQAFKIQYKAATDCTVLTGYTDIGASTSSDIWRFANSASSGISFSQLQISTSEVAEAYAEANPTVTNPNSVSIDQDMEWDFGVQHNGAAENTTYCFKIIKSDGNDFGAGRYQADGFPKVNTAPGTGDLMRHGNVFVDESEKGFFWAN